MSFNTRSILISFKIRPAFKLAILFIIGLTIGYYYDIPFWVLLPIFVTLFIAATTSLCVNFSLLNFVLIIALIFAGIVRYELASRVFPANHIVHFLESDEPTIILGRIAGFPHQKPNRLEVEIEVTNIVTHNDSITTTGKALTRLWRLDLAPEYGDLVQISGRIQQPRGERNPGEFNYQKFLAANGIHGIINVSKSENIIIQPSQQNSIQRLIYAVKKKFFQSLNQLYQGQSQALIKALLLGERGEISPELRVSFARSGVIHALAISGLHIGYLSVIFYVLFSLLRLNYQARTIAVLITIFCYDLLIGFEPPIVRASVMMGIFLLGRLLQRPIDILNVISTAAIIILLINPQELFQASFQLSFAAILSIVYLFQRFKIFFDKLPFFRKLTKTKFGEYLGLLFLVSLSAQLGTLPISAYYFGRIPIAAFLLNLLVIPVVGVVIALGFATLIFSLISMPIAQLYANTNMFCLDFLIRVIEQVGKLKFSAIEISEIGLIFIAIYYFLVWIILNLDKKIYRKVFAYSIVIAALTLAWKPIFKNNNWMEVIYFDVGQGDAALVTFPGGKNILIDAGPKLKDFDAGEFFILPYLKREGINRLNTVILSHADNDHIGGMASIFRKIQVRSIYDNGIYQQSSTCSTYQAVIESLKIQHNVIQAGDRLDGFEKGGVYFLHPVKGFSGQFRDDINNCSVVVKIVFGNRSFLFPGDIEQNAETMLLKYGELLQADVLKVAHHGSNTSSSLAWLELVQPEFAVISAGRNNRFDFPAPSVIKRLNHLGIKTYRTDLNGAVVFRTDGERLERVR